MNSPKFSQDPSQSFGSGESRSSVAQAARETASKIGSAASTTAARVRESAEKLASEHKDTAADRVGAYSSAIHETAKSLEEQDPNIAWLTHRAADRLESVANYVRTRDFRGLREDAENIARRHPVAFFGGMCLAGLVLGSVIRAAREASSSSGPVNADDDLDSDYPSYMGGQSAQAGERNRGNETSLEDLPAQGTTSAEI